MGIMELRFTKEKHGRLQKTKKLWFIMLKNMVIYAFQQFYTFRTLIYNGKTMVIWKKTMVLWIKLWHNGKL